MLKRHRTSMPKHLDHSGLFVPKHIHEHVHRLRTEHFAQYSTSGSPAPQLRPGQRLARKMLNLPGFELFMGGVIFATMIVMVIEIDQTTDEHRPTGKTSWTDVFGWLALIIFIMELSVRLVAFRHKFWQDPWNVSDFIIVCVDAIFSLVSLAAGTLFPVSVLRIFRLAKLARVSKVLGLFPELRLLLAGLVSSFSAIFWGTLLLVLFLVLWAMVAVLFLHPLNKEIDYGDCERCPRAYSSVLNATLTFWQQIVSGDSWGQATIPLIEKHPITAIVFIPVFLSIGLALINLILGVVVSVAQKAKEDLEEEQEMETLLTKVEKETHLIALCRDMDSNQSGELTHDDLLAGMEKPGEFRDLMGSLGITEEDFEIVWTMLDHDASGSVSYKEFVQALCSMKNTNQAFMLTYIKYYITLIRSTLMTQMHEHHTEAMTLQENLDKHFKKIEQTENELLEVSPRRNSQQNVGESGGLESHQEGVDLEIPDAHVNGSEPPSKGNGIDTGLEMPQSDLKSALLERVATYPNASVSDSAQCSTNIGGVRGETSASMTDETQVLLNKICYDIGLLRDELKDFARDTINKLGPQSRHEFLSSQSIKNRGSHLDLPTVSDSTSSYTFLCCQNSAHTSTVVEL